MLMVFLGDCDAQSTKNLQKWQILSEKLKLSSLMLRSKWPQGS